MPYPVNKTDGTLLVNLQDYTRDNSTTSVTLLGRAVVDYGEGVAENFVHMLENFASPTAPANPLEGQLWWHNYDPGPPARVINKIKVWDGLKWIPVGGANTDPVRPTNPQPGDLWYNQETKAIYFWNGTQWIKVGTPNIGQPGDPGDPGGPGGPGGPGEGPDGPIYEPPPDPTEGELWWMLPERQLWAFDEEINTPLPVDAKRRDGRPVPAGWVLIGPLAAKQSDTYISYGTIVNNSTVPPQVANVIKVIVNGQLVAMWSDRAIVLPSDMTDGMKFTTYDPTGATNLAMRPGLNMNDSLGTWLNGIAINSDLLDGLDSSQFLRRDQGDFPTVDGFLDLGKPDARWRRFYAGHLYGLGNEPGTYDEDEVVFHGKAKYAERADKSIELETPFQLEALPTGFVEGKWTDINGKDDRSTELKLSAAGKTELEDITKEIVEEVLEDSGGGPRFISAQESTPQIGPNVVIGAETNRIARIYAIEFDGVSTKARYADLAERYAADAVYAPGTVVMIGGTHEVTQTVHENDPRVFGVVSFNPAHLMNEGAGNDETHPAIALVGRVPVRVIGPCAKGDRLVSGPTPGTAMALSHLDSATHAFAIIGRALADKLVHEEGLVECMVSVK